ALWLTTYELQSIWLPARQRGELTFGGDVRELTFAVQTAGARGGARPLVELVRAGKVPADREENVLALIAALGNPQELQMIFDLVGRDVTSAKRKAVLLEGLAQAVRQRGVRPAGDLGNLAPLLSVKEEAVREAAARLAGLWKLESGRGRLSEIATASDTPLSVRRAACEALVGLAGRASAETL